MNAEDQELAEKLADAAEEYLAVGDVDTPVDRAKVAVGWSMEGWQAVARRAGLEYPHYGVMREALGILIERCRPAP